VLLTGAPEGGWGLGGHANTNAELVSAEVQELSCLAIHGMRPRHIFACVDDDGVIRKEKRANGRACGGATRYPLQRLLA